MKKGLWITMWTTNHLIPLTPTKSHDNPKARGGFIYKKGCGFGKHFENPKISEICFSIAKGRAP
jgi:hypothetical protein